MVTLTTDQLIARLLALHPKGFDLTLDRITRLLARLDDPHTKLPPVIHIAGTNGKGSSAAFARALMEAGGRSVHVHTSPHLVRWHERYRIGAPDGGRFVEDAVLAEAVSRVADANEGQMITLFEILTAVTFILFAEHPADVAIVEVGLGGRFDATNVIDRPAVTLITSVSLDHEAFLGDRVELIAVEKAGIIKPGCPVVIGQQEHDAAREVLIDTAERQGCPLLVYGHDFLAYEENGRMVYQDSDGLMDLTLPRLKGRHQLANAAAAIAAVKTAGFDASMAICDRSMQTVEWRGRLQRLTGGELKACAPEGAEVWLDGGHNPGAGAAITEALAEMEERDPRPLYVVAGMIATKDQTGYFRNFAGMAKRIFTVPVEQSEAGVPNDELAARAMEAGVEAEPISSVRNALLLLREASAEGDVPPRILICGSLYLVGAVLAENGTPPE